MDTLSPQTRRLFQHLRKRWLPEPDLQDGFLESLEGYASLQEHLRSDEGLHRLSSQMYADLKDVVVTSDDDTASSGRRKRSRKDRDDSRLTWKEVHEILHIIQTMEVAWMNARMDNFDAHPLNRGWVAVFHRWATMPAFRRAWPILRAEFSRPFIDYLESRFSLTVTFSDLQTVPSARSQSPDVLRILTDEFTSEWPEVDLNFPSICGRRVRVGSDRLSVC